MAGVLYFGSVEDKPILGKFNVEETFKFSNEDSMWSEIEEIKEDDVVNEAEEQLSDIIKRKKRNKRLRFKRNIRKLHIESMRSNFSQAPKATASIGAVEGTLLDTTVEDSSSQYVLLQVLKPNDPKTCGINMESHKQAGGGAIVKVIPVGDWYNFQRPSKMSSNVTLDEINIDFDRQEKLLKQRKGKFKLLTERTSNDGATRRSKVDQTADDDESRASKLFGSVHFQKKGSILKRMNFKGHMADSGADVDEEMERDGNEEDNDADFDCFEQGEGDDDEEQYVEEVQAQDNEAEELYANRMDSPFDDSSDDYLESDEETDDEEIEKILKSTTTVATARKAIGGSYGEGSGFQEAAREFAAVQRANRKKEALKKREERKQQKLSETGDAGTEGDIAAGVGQKRGRAERDDQNGEDDPRQSVDFDYKKVKSGDSLDANEANIKAYITQQGGMVQLKRMYKPFKSMMEKQYGENAKSEFKQILYRYCKNIEDSTLGKVVVLKVNPKLAALPSTSNT